MWPPQSTSPTVLSSVEVRMAECRDEAEFLRLAARFGAEMGPGVIAYVYDGGRKAMKVWKLRDRVDAPRS